MKTLTANRILTEWDRKGRYVFRKEDLAKLFGTELPVTFQATLARLVNEGVLYRCARGVYVYALSAHLDGYTVERIADTLRRGEYNFLSLESALSSYGAISQIPVDRITVVTTGRRGEYVTPFGVIEFTHTDSPPEEILANTRRDDAHPLRIATKEYAAQGLRRTGRNLEMMEIEA